jgi:ribose transport system substrate-binding protein
VKKIVALTLSILMLHSLLFTTPSFAAPAPPRESKLAWYAPAPHPFYEEVKMGVEEWAKENGVEVIYDVGPDWSVAIQNERVEALVAQGITGLSIYPSDPVATNGLYEEIMAVGVNVINYAADTVRPNASKFGVATDVYEAAYTACTKLIELMGGKGSILNVLELLEDPNTVLRKKAIDDCIAAHPEVKLIQEIAGIKTTVEAVSKIESALSANVGKIDGIITTGFTPSIGLAQALPDYYAQQGKDKRISAIVIDNDPIISKAISDGILDGTIVQNPKGQGIISMTLLKLMDEGYRPADPEHPFIPAGHMFVDKNNLNTYHQEVDVITKQILSEITTKYLTK